MPKLNTPKKVQKALRSRMRELKAAFLIQDWDLKLVVDPTLDSYGNFGTNVPYKSGVIRVNPTAEDPASDNAALDTLYHELGEVVVHEPMGGVPEQYRTADWFETYRDQIADKIGRIVQHQTGDLR